jgi:hypothetical protein
MLNIQVYTVMDGLRVSVLGVDSREIPADQRLPSENLGRVILADQVEELGLDRAVCTAVTDILMLKKELVELALL